MPSVIGGAVLAGIVGGVTVTTVTAGVITYGTWIGIGFSWSSFATSLILGGLSMALSPDKPSGLGPQLSKGITRQVREPITTRKLVYGEARVSGGIVYISQTNENKFLHIILPVAGHPVEEIGEVWLNDYSITDDMLDGDGDVNTGRFSGIVRIRKHTGSTSQTADSELVASDSAWTTDHRLRGVAYVYARYKFDRDEFPSGIPNLSAWVKGRKLLDPRITVGAYSYSGNSVDLSSHGSGLTGIFIKPDGTKFYVTFAGADYVHQYSMSTAWDLSTATYDSKSGSVGGEDSAVREVWFKSDGTKMYAAGNDNDTVFQYTLGTAWDISTLSYDSVSFNHSAQSTDAFGLAFDDDGDTMYVVDAISGYIYQYTLGTAWDLSTAAYASKSLDTSSQTTTPTGLCFNTDGTKAFVSDQGDDKIYIYTLGTAWDISTGTVSSTEIDVSGQASTSRSVFIKPDETEVYTVNNNTPRAGYQYSQITTQTRWSPNVALMVHDYLVDEPYGYGATSDEIDSTFTASAANICDEIVDMTNYDFTVASVDASSDTIEIDDSVLGLQTGDRVRFVSSGAYPGGLIGATDYYVIVYQRKDTPRIRLASTLDNAYAGAYINISSAGSGSMIVRRNGEPRYAGGGVLDSADTLKDNLEKMLPSMAGRAVYGGGAWRILAGAYSAPTITLTADDLAGPVTTQTRLTRLERFNTVKGKYASPSELGLESDFPAYTNSTYVTNDGGEIIRDLNQPFTQRPQQATRIAKIELEKSRQEIVFIADFNLKAMQLQAGDTVNITFDRYGWSAKAFEVTQWTLDIRDGDEEGTGRPVVAMTLRETASALFDWNNGEETVVDPAPNSNLPDAFTVSVVLGFSLDAILIDTQGGDKIYNTVASWELHTNQFVVSGGEYEVFYKRTTETVYKSAGVVDGSITTMEIPALQPDVLYDIQIVAYNNLGVASAPTTIEDYKVGTSVTTNTEDWENETLSRDGDDWETDSLSSEDWET